jgi:hypothetical protein
MNTQHITNKQIIEANRRALANGTLGAVNGYKDCQYIYSDGSRCAIGQCLTQESLDTILTHRSNGQRIEVIQRLNFITFEDNDVARFTQMVHDQWTMKRRTNTVQDNILIFIDDRTPPWIADWFSEHADRTVDGSLFTDWLDFLETRQ